MREVLHKENNRKKLLIEVEKTEKSTQDFKGEKYQINRVYTNIKTRTGKNVASIVEGNCLGSKGGVEFKVNATAYFYKNFFALCVHEEEWDKIMGVLDEERYKTSFYTYKGLHMETIGRVWSQNPQAIDMYNTKAWMYDADREELEREKE